MYDISEKIEQLLVGIELVHYIESKKKEVFNIAKANNCKYVIIGGINKDNTLDVMAFLTYKAMIKELYKKSLISDMKYEIIDLKKEN